MLISLISKNELCYKVGCEGLENERRLSDELLSRA